MKVAIAGYGVEGEASYHYWQSQSAEITIFDETQPSRTVPAGAKLVVGKDVFASLSGFDLVIRTPSLNPNKIKTDGKVWSATREFFEKCPAQIIGVTGTKGKGTTSSLVYEILKSAGKSVHLAGNIGKPMLDVLSDVKQGDIVVLELSSFQLWDLQQSPHIAVVLMIEPDHLNVHDSFEDYVQAKANICRYQSATDAVYYHPTNQYSVQVTAMSPARKYHYMTSESAHIENGEIVINEQRICSSHEVGLLGEHNLENICAAVSAAWEYTQDVEVIKQAITTFKGLPHRLEFVRELNGIKFYDDSYSSATSATEAAVKSFTQPMVLVCGGFDRGISMEYLAKTISTHQNIKQVILMGQTKYKIADELKRQGFDDYKVMTSTDFGEIVRAARAEASPGDIVVLSPGCASFDMFKNFEDRGQQFKQIVKGLK